MRCCERLRRLVNKKSVIVFIIVGLSFHLLFRVRSNPNALNVGDIAPDIQLETIDGTHFNLYDSDKPVMLVFFNTKVLLSGGVYNKLYLNRIPYMNAMEDVGRAKLIILLDTDQTKKDITKEFLKSGYKILEKRVYLGNIKQTEKKYGISIRPHFFLIDNKNHTILYEAKVPTMELVDDILDRSL